MEEKKIVASTPKILVKVPMRSKSNIQSATPQSKKTLSKISLTYNSWLTRFNIQPKVEVSKNSNEGPQNPSERTAEVDSHKETVMNELRMRARSKPYAKNTTLTLSPTKNTLNPSLKKEKVSRVPSQIISKTQIKASKPDSPMKQDPLNDYIIGNTIGTGAYGIVKYGIHKATNRKVAIKIYEKSKISDINRQKSVQGEIKILSKIDHPNIVKLYQTIDTQKFLYIILEFISGCSLSTLLKRKINRRMEEFEANKLFRELLMALDYCHSKNVSHRDIKLENTLIDQNNIVKLIDFGFATCFPNDKKVKIFCGTPSYMAPEIVSRKEYLGPPVDIWAAGVLLYALITGNFPFKANCDKDLYKQILKCNYPVPEYISISAKHLIAKMLCVDPLKRAKASDLLKDSWFRASSAFSVTGSIIHKAEESEDHQDSPKIFVTNESPKYKILSNSSNSLDLHICSVGGKL
jgi:tRNA A-37 threonylcarbamoyl transferase component Bud32